MDKSQQATPVSDWMSGWESSCWPIPAISKVFEAVQIRGLTVADGLRDFIEKANREVDDIGLARAQTGPALRSRRDSGQTQGGGEHTDAQRRQRDQQAVDR